VGPSLGQTPSTSTSSRRADGVWLSHSGQRRLLLLLRLGPAGYAAAFVVLDEWCPRIPALALYYPGHRQVPAGLRASVEMLKETERGKA
jgi:hypothetical protein